MELHRTPIIDQSSEMSPFREACRKAGTIWLDSSLVIGDRGHCSYQATGPILDVCLEQDRLVVQHADGRRIESSARLARDYLRELWSDASKYSVGYVSYEAMLPLVGINPKRVPGIPALRFLVYDSLVELPAINYGSSPWDDFDAALAAVAPRHHRAVSSSLTRSEYLERVATIKEHIRQGDIYQANLTCRFEVKTAIDPFDAYCRLRSLNPAPYSAYLNFGDYQILSSSPERMFLKTGDRITTGPIKGTIAHGNTAKETEANRRTLLRSEKDRAELLMIVDLERNDLGRVCRTGSVTVDTIFRPEVYSSVIHLVSDVSGRLRDGTDVVEIISALGPGGSITGAPKKRAVEILQQLEPVPRSVYTGLIGYVHGNRADFNIAIRTMVHQNGTYHIHAGGGIVADSRADTELEEMLLKAGNMMRALGINPEDQLW
jgi:aminodeoxychorismate synthase component I